MFMLLFYLWVFFIAFYFLCFLVDKYDTKYPNFRANYPILARIIRYSLAILLIILLVFLELNLRR